MKEHELAVALKSAELCGCKSWCEMSWGERIRSVLRVVLGGGDDIITILASEIIPRKVKWLWPDRVPLGKLTLFVGDPDNGKSMVATYVAATVSTGGDWSDDVKNPCFPGEVLIFASEDDPDDTTVPRLMASGANLSSIRFARMSVGEMKETQAEREMRLDKDSDTIKKFLGEHPRIRLVVINPVSNYLGETKMNDEQAVRRALSPFQRLAAETSVAIIGIMHLNKKGDLKAINRIGGAMAFVGVARAVWLFARAPENPEVFHMVGVKKNIGKRVNGLKFRITTKPVKIEGEDLPQPYVDWLGESDQSVDNILPAKPVGRPRDERNAALEWLKHFLSDGPKPSKEVELQGEVAGFKYRTLERAKDEPGSGVEAFREGDKWNWKIADPGIRSANEAQEARNH